LYKLYYQDITGIIITEIIGDFGFQKFANNGGITSFIFGVGDIMV
jgi:hypothetical protein